MSFWSDECMRVVVIELRILIQDGENIDERREIRQRGFWLPGDMDWSFWDEPRELLEERCAEIVTEGLEYVIDGKRSWIPPHRIIEIEQAQVHTGPPRIEPAGWKFWRRQ